MGRRRDISNDGDNSEQQSPSPSTTTGTTIASRTTSSLMDHESQKNPIRDFDENKMNDDDDNDPLIHDTILPHRKRIRKDPSQHVQLSQSTSSVSSSSSSSSSSTTNLRIDCNIKTETTDTLKTNNFHQQQTLAITRAFDNLAKAAAHPRPSTMNNSFSVKQQQYLFNEKRYWEQVERPLITEKTSRFVITPPTNRDFQQMQSLPTNSFICESASRILFQSIDWIKNNTCFQTLEPQTQIMLLQNHWLPLFVLSLLQCSSMINLTNILTALITKKLDSNESNKWLELRRIQTLLYEFERLRITDIEYAYLKLMSVFNPIINVESIPFYEQVDAYRTLTYKELRDYINDRLISTSYDEYCGDSERLGRLLLKLPSLAELDTNIIEELFFVGLIGSVQIHKIIPCILKMDVTSSSSSSSKRVSPMSSSSSSSSLIKFERSEQMQQQALVTSSL